MIICEEETNDGSFNLLARLVNTITTALKERSEIPKYLIILLEDDIINYVNYDSFGVTEMFGKIADYLNREIKRTINEFKGKYLPPRARKFTWPQVIWIVPTLNEHYSNNILRKKFGGELTAIVKNQHQAHGFKLKQLWNNLDSTAVTDGVINETGARKLFNALDRTIRYMVFKLQKEGTFSSEPARQGRLPHGECTLPWYRLRNPHLTWNTNSASR